MATSKTRGDLAKARRVLRAVDDLLELTRDPEVFTTVSVKEVHALAIGLERCRSATANIMASLGDVSGYIQTPSEE